MRRKNFILLLLAALIWGFAFVAQTTGGDLLGPYGFNCIRCFIGAAVLAPFALKSKTKLPFKAGLYCGIVFFLATSSQQLAISLGASAGKAGFLTSCYMLLVPILSLFLHKKCGVNIWFGVFLSVIGLYLLCIKDDFYLEANDLLLLLCALLFALHILVIDHFAGSCDGVKLSCFQFIVCGILSIVPTYLLDMNHSLPGFIQWLSCLQNITSIISLLYAGVLSCGVAYTFQILGQRDSNPTLASLIMSLESAFSALAGWLILHQKLTPRELSGCLLIFIAVCIAQIPKESLPRNKKKQNTTIF